MGVAMAVFDFIQLVGDEIVYDVNRASDLIQEFGDRRVREALRRPRSAKGEETEGKAQKKSRGLSASAARGGKADAGFFASATSALNDTKSACGLRDLGGYLPVNLGGRFSKNAFTPSLKSSECVIITIAASSSCTAVARSVNRCW